VFAFHGFLLSEHVEFKKAHYIVFAFHGFLLLEHVEFKKVHYRRKPINSKRLRSAKAQHVHLVAPLFIVNSHSYL
jgi:hypothetical protein